MEIYLRPTQLMLTQLLSTEWDSLTCTKLCGWMWKQQDNVLISKKAISHCTNCCFYCLQQSLLCMLFFSPNNCIYIRQWNAKLLLLLHMTSFQYNWHSTSHCTEYWWVNIVFYLQSKKKNSQDLNLGHLNSGQMLLPTEPLVLWQCQSSSGSVGI